MSIVQTEWWCLELPDEWSADMEDDCVTISDCDSVGSIDITVVRKDSGNVSEEELRDFSSDLLDAGERPNEVVVNEASGLLFAYDEEGHAWREWYLRKGPVLVYITYNSELENKGLDDAIVDEILGTLVILENISPDA